MPPAADQDPRQTARQKQEMERYADYRSYLTFRMYERVEDEHGVVKKNPVDEMAGRDSGGEGQNPKYVSAAGGLCHALYAAEQHGIPRSAWCFWTRRSPRWTRSAAKCVCATHGSWSCS